MPPAKAKIRSEIGKPSRDSRGRRGVRVVLSIASEGWHGHYRIDTHGRTHEEIVAERDRILAHHEKKAARMQGFAHQHFRRDVEHGGSAFEVRDCLIVERGSDVLLKLILRDRETGERLVIEEFRATVNALPGDEEIREMMQTRAAAHVEERARAEEHAERITRLLG